VAVKGNIVVNNAETLYELALLGVGLIRLADLIVGPAIRSGRLVAVLTDEHQPEPLPLARGVHAGAPTTAEGGRGDPVPAREVRVGALAAAAPRPAARPLMPGSACSRPCHMSACGPECPAPQSSSQSLQSTACWLR
jgi:DNA-binding transcriptional LysR family regulator